MDFTAARLCRVSCFSDRGSVVELPTRVCSPVMEPASMALEIQTATIDHLDAILARMRQMQEDDPWSEAFDEAVVRANLTALLANPAYGVIYVAQDGGVP